MQLFDQTPLIREVVQALQYFIERILYVNGNLVVYL